MKAADTSLVVAAFATWHEHHDAELDPDRVARGNAALGHLERHLAERDWLIGPRPTLADVALPAYTRVAHEGGFDLATRPRVRAWIARAETGLGVTES